MPDNMQDRNNMDQKQNRSQDLDKKSGQVDKSNEKNIDRTSREDSSRQGNR